MKINFIYSIDNDLYWQDGLRSVMRRIERDNEVVYINTTNDLSGLSDTGLIMYWGNFFSPLTREIVKLPHKKVLLFAAGLTPEQVQSPYAHAFDSVFVETGVELRWFRHIGVNAQLAFGIDTTVYKPMQLNKVWDCLYPAAFAVWKRHDLFVEYCKANNKKGLAIGYIQPDGWERECYDVCFEGGVDVLPRVTPDVMPYFYNMSREVVVTATEVGGGLRALSEAKACGIPVNKELLNPRLLDAYNEPLHDVNDYYEALWKEVSRYE